MNGKNCNEYVLEFRNAHKTCKVIVFFSVIKSKN
jgi:hypothetical protein